MFAQDTTITVRSGDIKFEYTFFKFFEEKYFGFILVFYFLFPSCYSFRSMYALCPTPCVILANQKQIGKGASFG
jgi:hypothetical protein